MSVTLLRCFSGEFIARLGRVRGIAATRRQADNHERELRPVLTRLNNPTPELVIDLRDHLRRADCIAVQVAPDTLSVTIADARSSAQERRSLRAYLASWTAARGVGAEVVGE